MQSKHRRSRCLLHSFLTHGEIPVPITGTSGILRKNNPAEIDPILYFREIPEHPEIGVGISPLVRILCVYKPHVYINLVQT